LAEDESVSGQIPDAAIIIGDVRYLKRTKVDTNLFLSTSIAHNWFPADGGCGGTTALRGRGNFQNT
jgi:hypothetical protein